MSTDATETMPYALAIDAYTKWRLVTCDDSIARFFRFLGSDYGNRIRDERAPFKMGVCLSPDAARKVVLINSVHGEAIIKAAVIRGA